MMEDDIGSMESDFLDLVEGSLSPQQFHWGAKQILGDDYKELGEQIVSEHEPSLMKKFQSYFQNWV